VVCINLIVFFKCQAKGSTTVFGDVTMAGLSLPNDNSSQVLGRFISKYYVMENTPKKYKTKEFLSYVLLFSVTSLS
jgi:hypothetical protein